MRQRLGLAGVMLGDPHTVILDEPANGLDPEGIRWIRDILVHFAQLGKTVLVSSHLLSEMALMAQDLVVIGRGRLIEQCSVADFIDRHSTKWVHVRSPQIDQLVAAIGSAGGKARRLTETGAAAERSPGLRDAGRGGRRAGGEPPVRPARADGAHRVARGRVPHGDGWRTGIPHPGGAP